MSIAAGAVWEIRANATANNVNGGFYVTGASGVDYSQQTAAQYALTGVTSAGAGNTVLTASAATDMVGNGIKVVSGTNFTAGWYEITAVSAGVSITCSTNAAGTSISTGVGVSGVMNVGGALSMNSTLDDDVFEAGTAGNTWYIRGAAGTVTLGETVSVSLAGTTSAPIRVIGYDTSRSSVPTGTSRPLIAGGANLLAWGAIYRTENYRLTGTGSLLLTTGSGYLGNCQVINSSTTTTRVAINSSSASVTENCEAVSYRGKAFEASGGTQSAVRYCYFHDSDTGMSFTGSPEYKVIGNIVSSCFSDALVMTAANVNSNTIIGNTFYGSENTTGNGLRFVTGVTRPQLKNNIIYGFVTGVNNTDAANFGYDDYNAYNNNDTPATNWTQGSNNVSTAPGFVNVTQSINIGTVSSSTNVLTDTGANFSNVVDGVTCVLLVSGTGTGFTANTIFGVVSHTTTTLTLTSNITSSGSGSSIVYQMTLGYNYGIGSNYKGLGFPGAFQGGYTTGYTDIGAVQRQEAGSSGASYTFG